MVERSLSMREALGSMPRFSIFLRTPIFFNFQNGRSPISIIRVGVNSSHSSVGQSVRLITVRSAVQARVGAVRCYYHLASSVQSKASAFVVK